MFNKIATYNGNMRWWGLVNQIICNDLREVDRKSTLI